MKLLIILFAGILIAIDNKVACLKSTDVCKNTNEECTGSFGAEFAYTLQCKKLPCTAPYTHACNENYCALNRETCGQLIEIRDLIYFAVYRWIFFSKKTVRLHLFTNTDAEFTCSVCF